MYIFLHYYNRYLYSIYIYPCNIILPKNICLVYNICIDDTTMRYKVFNLKYNFCVIINQAPYTLQPTYMYDMKSYF